LLLFSLVVLGLSFVFFRIHPFLAPTHGVDTDILVVEGWISHDAILAAAAEFSNGGYRRIYVTGGPVAGTGAYINDFNTSANVGADLLKAAGLSSQLVQAVPSRVRTRDRTYGSALALRQWFREHDVDARKLNVVTEGVHGRRSRLLFQEVFGRNVQIGIISLRNGEYDPDHWWRYSEGVKEVISEGGAYLYAKFLFRPEN
jgi:uncharacterized SAM-binding protein YcdF (DUF218 family)